MFQKCIVALAVGCLSTSCLHLQKVNDYAAASGKGLKKFEELEYTFSKACSQRCQLNQIRNLQLRKDNCPCKSEETADSVTVILYKAIKGYYDGLSKISANNLTAYKLDAMTKSLKSGQFGDIKINKAEVDAYAKVSAILLRAFTDEYRRSKIRNYIAEANEPLQILISALDFNMTSGLSGKLDTYKQRIESVYWDFVNDTTASSFEKKKAIVEYNNLLDQSDEKQKQITSFSKVLKSISTGHQKLYEHRKNIKAKDIKAILMQHASDLEDIVSEFNKLKNK